MNAISNRIEWLDVAKGIVIMLMILGHSGMPKYASNVIFAFHMPFFFVASGFTTNFEKTSFVRFCWNKLKSLGIPFVIYSAVNLVLWPVAKGKVFSDFWCNFLAVGWEGVALWFIPVLFFALVIAKMVYMIKVVKIRYALILLLPIISSMLCYFQIMLPWNLSVVPFASFFILAGDFCKRYMSSFSSLYWKRWCWFAVCLVTFVSISQVWRMDMAWNKVIPMVPKIIAALCGCYCVATVSAVIAEKMSPLSKIIQAVGRETYVIVAFSQIIIFSTNTFLKIGVISKYALLIAVLVLIAYSKNLVVRTVKSK